MTTAENWYDKLIQTAESNRLGMFAFMILFYGNIIAPVTLLVILSNSGSAVQFFICAFTAMSTLVSNLAQMSARTIIPMFIATIGIHLLFLVINLI